MRRVVVAHPLQLSEHHLFVLQDDEPLHHVLEFPDVAGPRVRQDGLAQTRGWADGWPAIAGGVFDQEELGQRDNLVPPFAQGRHADIDDLQPVVQILAELSRPNHLPEVTVGGGNHAHVDGDRAIAAEAREFAVLQHVKELGLQRGRHLPDLIEHDRALMGEFELAHPEQLRPGKSAALVAEQFAFEQVSRQRGAVHLDEGLGAPGRPPMELARNHFLANPRLAGNQHADVAVGHALDHRQHLAHRNA